MPACRRHYPGRFDGADSLVLLHQRRPSPISRWVGSCINRFEACSAFTHVTACMLAKSPRRPSTSEAPTASFPPPPLRLLPGGAIQFPGGTFTRSEPAPFTAHVICRFITTHDGLGPRTQHFFLTRVVYLHPIPEHQLVEENRPTALFHFGGFA
jgi:hypothetical protein